VEKVNLKQRASGVSRVFEYLKVGQLNDHVLIIITAENRTLDFHVHDDSDEMFLVIEGRMQIEFEDRLVDLNEGDFLIVPQGTRHRPLCSTLVKCLLIEKDGTLTKDNTGGTYSE
jgi:mannose-6-phosphate isomerase-like protein (cupin superfamily)